MNRTIIRKSILGIVVAATAALATVSCQKDDTLYYNNFTMGNIVDGRFVSDQGNTFNVVENTCDGKLESEKRVMLRCDVLNATEGSSKEYDIRLTGFHRVLTKEAVALEDASEGEISVQDPVHIEELWFAGGYINMMIRVPMKAGSETKHFINLVHSKKEDGKYVFNLRHNGYGEVWSEENKSQIVISGGSYVSFPIADLIKEDEATIILNWKWYEANEMTYNFNKEKNYEFEYNWKRSGFIQKF